MKKLFTLLTLLVAIVTGAQAAETVTMDLALAKGSTPEPSIGAALMSGGAFDGSGYKLGSDGNYIGWDISSANKTFTAVTFKGYINTTNTAKNWAFQFSTDGGTTWTSEVTQANDGTKSYHNIDVTVTIPSGANAIRIIRRAGTSSYVSEITLTVEESDPSDTRTNLVGAWSDDAPTFDNGATATIPQFIVTGGTPVTDYSVSYELTTDGGNVTVDETNGITAIDTETAGTSVVKATINVINTTEYKATTTEYTCTIKVKEVAKTLTAASDYFWKFNNTGWSEITGSSNTISESTIIDNMEVLANSGNTAYVREGTQTIGGESLTNYIQFGQVKADSRQLHIKVAGNSKISVYLNTGGTGRKIKVTKDSKDGTVVGTEQDVASGSGVYTFDYTDSTEGDLYIFNSGSSSLNFYGVKVESLISDPVFTITPAEIEVGSAATISGPDGLAYSAVIKEGAATDVVSIEGATISALKAGTTTVTISSEATSIYNAYSHDFEITVTGVKTETTMAFDNPTTNVELNGTVQNVATLTGGPEGATISYESSDETVATVAADGTVTGKKIGGTATITASYAGNDEYKASEASYEISVVAPALVAVDNKVWNGNDWLTNPGTGDITTTKWIDNLEVVGTSTNYITIASGGSKSHPDFPSGFNVRVKTNGTSTEDARFFHFIVKPNTKISVYAIRSTNDGGTFALATGSRTNEAAAHTFEADGIEKLEYIYAGADNTDVYVYAKENAISFLAFKVAPYEVIVLDENGGNSDKIEAANGKTINVTVARTLSPNYYNSLFLPFAMTAEQITAAFGEGAQVATFTGMNSETQFGFGNVTAMEANVPYLVKPAQEVNGFTVEGVTISNTTPNATVDGGYGMVGTYDEFTNGSASSGGLVIGGLGGSSSSSYEIYYFTTSNTIKKLKTDGTGKIKGLRSFMVKLPSGKTSVETIVSNAGITFGGDGSGDARARQSFVLNMEADNATTAISTIDADQAIDVNAPMYNLAGQKVGKNYKGIVIINGKKVVK